LASTTLKYNLRYIFVEEDQTNHMKKRSYSLAFIAIIGFIIIVSFMAASMFNTRAVSSGSSEWRLSVSGIVNNSLNLTLADLSAMPQTTVQATIYCVDFPSRVVTEGSWTGVQLKTLLEQAGVLPSAVKIAFSAADGYTTDLDLETATHENVIVAYEKDGAPLAETLRLVVPDKWGYKWISQLTNIRLVDYDFKGKWESQGYSDEAVIPGYTTFPSTKPAPSSPSPNETEPATPSSNSQSSNSSATLPPQRARSTAEPGPQASDSFPIGWIAMSVAAVVITSCLLLAYVKKRRNEQRTQ
jgi:DMSO/TMAO reductase YedYZ molybdopterin-dependent catalytic subunit